MCRPSCDGVLTIMLLLLFLNIPALLVGTLLININFHIPYSMKYCRSAGQPVIYKYSSAYLCAQYKKCVRLLKEMGQLFASGCQWCCSPSSTQQLCSIFFILLAFSVPPKQQAVHCRTLCWTVVSVDIVAKDVLLSHLLQHQQLQ